MQTLGPPFFCCDPAQRFYKSCFKRHSGPSCFHCALPLDCCPVTGVLQLPRWTQRSHPPQRRRGMPESSCAIQKIRRLWRRCSERRSPPKGNMMSAMETGPMYQPAQLLNWVYMSLQDSPSSAFDAFRAESDSSPGDTSKSKRSAADLGSNYLNNFFHLRSQVEFMSCYSEVCAEVWTVHQCFFNYHHWFSLIQMFVVQQLYVAMKFSFMPEVWLQFSFSMHARWK